MNPTYTPYSLNTDLPARWRIAWGPWGAASGTVHIAVAFQEQHDGEWATDPDAGWWGTAEDARALAAALMEAADACG